MNSRFALVEKAVGIVMLCVALAAGPVWAGEEDDARSAASAIRTAISNQDYEDLWNSRVSEFFKGKVQKTAFIQNLKQGRAQVGASRSVTPVSYTFAEVDPTTGYRGKIYSFDYHVKYEKAAFFERLVVVKDPDGRYRLAGAWANPAPQ